MQPEHNPGYARASTSASLDVNGVRRAAEHYATAASATRHTRNGKLPNISARGVVHITTSNLCRPRPHAHQLYNSFAREQKGTRPCIGLLEHVHKPLKKQLGTSSANLSKQKNEEFNLEKGSLLQKIKRLSNRRMTKV